MHEILMPYAPVDPEGRPSVPTLRWRRNMGDAVAKGDVLLEVESGKFAREVAAERDGVLTAILVPSGQHEVSKGSVLGIIDDVSLNRGANVSYRLTVPFEEAAALKPQRVTLGNGQTIDLKLPAGVENGTRLRLRGRGDDGPDGAGDAVITIEILPHDVLTRDGDDVCLDLAVDLSDVETAKAVKVPTVDGPVMLTVRRGATSGTVLRLKERGFHRKEGGRRDQLVTLATDAPLQDEARHARDGAKRKIESQKPLSATAQMDEIFARIDRLIGLGQVKSELRKLAAFARTQSLRREHGRRTPQVSLHLVFTGNPGTGKTTVARFEVVREIWTGR